ncbi:YciI family protein [Streptomyces sp. SID3343]|uniref:YciI family protein n=1 Tax=Streptomyces sp. SID3343 TaxID=2690260 RepID=UPI001926AA2C|nr:YciI family protein [Streptomyces sp. SID3343]
MLMIYNRPGFLEEFSEAERTELFGDVDVLMRELTESGELIGGEALADPSNTKTVRVRDGVAAVTDGPFTEAKEHFAGYLLVECEGVERAVEIAASWPDAKRWAMEVRPVMSGSGTEM